MDERPPELRDGDEAPLLGQVHPFKHLGVDPLYGADLPARNTREVAFLPLSYIMRTESMNGSKWDGVKIPWTLCINSMLIGTVVGIGGAAFKIVGNLALAAAGVVFLPIKMGESGDVYPSTTSYVRYQLYQFQRRYGFTAMWNRALGRLDAAQFPVTKGGRYMRKFTERDGIAMWRVSKKFPDYHKAIRPSPFTAPPPAPFPAWLTRTHAHEPLTRFFNRLYNFYSTHPLKGLAMDERRRLRIDYHDPLPFGSRMHLFFRWLLPQSGHLALRYSIITLRMFKKSAKRGFEKGLLMPVLAGTHLMLWQLLAPAYVADNMRGSVFVFAFMTGWWHYKYLYGHESTWYPRVPVRQWSGLILSGLLLGALLDYAVLDTRLKLERLEMQPSRKESLRTRFGDQLSELVAKAGELASKLVPHYRNVVATVKADVRATMNEVHAEQDCSHWEAMRRRFDAYWRHSYGEGLFIDADKARPTYEVWLELRRKEFEDYQREAHRRILRRADDV